MIFLFIIIVMIVSLTDKIFGINSVRSLRFYFLFIVFFRIGQKMMIRSTSLYLMCLTMMICLDLASLSSFAVIPPEHTHADRHTHNFSSIHRESSFVINWNNNKIARYNSFSSHCFVGVCCCLLAARVVFILIHPASILLSGFFLYLWKAIKFIAII